MVNWRGLHGERFAGRRVMVTGAAGFIGSHLVEALTALGAEVVGVDDLSTGDWGNLRGFDERVKQVTASVLDGGALGEAMRGCEIVIHHAALASVPQSLVEPERFYQVNVMGTLRVLEAARGAGVGRVVYAGSSSAYGDVASAEPRREDWAAIPASPYASSKLAGEHLMQAWASSYGLDTVVLRYFNVFGPRQNANSAYAAVIVAFAKALQEGRAAVIYGDGEQTRDFVAVQNVVQANLLAAGHGGKLAGGIFNVGTGQAITVNRLWALQADLWGKGGMAARHESSREGDVRHSSADIGRAREVLGYKPVVGFEEALGATVRWYRAALAK